MKKWLALSAAAWLAMGVAATAQTTTKKVMQQPAPCKADQLSLALDSEHGAFDGMSHSGTLLVLRNPGPTACAMPALPQLQWEDAGHKPLAVDRRAPVGMHPGPVMLPVVVSAGAEVTAKLRWMDGDVYGGGSSANPAFLVVPVDGGQLSVAFQGRIFGPKDRHPEYTQTPLRRDLAWCGCKK